MVLNGRLSRSCSCRCWRRYRWRGSRSDSASTIAVVGILRGPTRFHVSLFSRHNAGIWRLQASTLEAEEREQSLRDLAADRFAAVDPAGNATYDAVALTRVLRLPAGAGESVVALLQEPMAAAMEPFHRLQRQLLLVSLIAVIVSMIASVLIARGIARPVHELASVARRIAGRRLLGAAAAVAQRRDRRPRAAAVRTMAERHRVARIADHGPRVPRHTDRAAQPRDVQ